jgi:hypothetical protein
MYSSSDGVSETDFNDGKNSSLFGRETGSYIRKLGVPLLKKLQTWSSFNEKLENPNVEYIFTFGLDRDADLEEDRDADLEDDREDE